jgi:hypothetical protein
LPSGISPKNHGTQCHGTYHRLDGRASHHFNGNQANIHTMLGVEKMVNLLEKMIKIEIFSGLKRYTIDIGYAMKK